MLGGLGVRLELTFETLEDLQVALDALLECCREDDEVTMEVRLGENELRLAVGPLDEQTLTEVLDHEPVDGPALQRVLDTVVDRVERTKRDDGWWLELTKRLGAGEAERG